MELMIMALLVVLNGVYIYWLHRRNQHLINVNRHQAATMRRLTVNAVEGSGKLLAAVKEMEAITGVVREIQERSYRAVEGIAEEAGKEVVKLIAELKNREEAAREQREMFNRFMVKLLKDNLFEVRENGKSNGNGRGKTVPLRKVNPQEDVEIHDHAGF